MWKPSSLFLRSEFIFWREHCELEDLGDAIVIRTPSNPYWRWGHLIVTKEPPCVEDLARWHSVYDKKIKPYQNTPNRIIIWDGPPIDDAAKEAYASDGLRYGSFDVLVLSSLTEPAHPNPRIEIRELAADSDRWLDVIESNVESFGPEADSPGYRDFTSRRSAQYQTMVGESKGHWYAAYIDNSFAGSLGLFTGDGLCRFQEVAVRPKFRKQSVASHLLYYATQGALAEHPEKPVIIVGARKSEAMRVYQSMGFNKHSESQSLAQKD
jgi:GNAT superfamily N-acetyltransferase